MCCSLGSLCDCHVVVLVDSTAELLSLCQGKVREALLITPA